MSGRLYSRLPIYKRRLRFVEAGIASMLYLAPDSYLSVSFGKQSICLAHFIYQHKPALPMFFLASSESWFIHNYVEVIDDFMQHTPINLTIVQTNRLGIDISEPIAEMQKRQPDIKWIYRGWSESLPESWKAARDAGDRDLQEMCNRDDWDGLFMGLVKEESGGRRITLSLKWNGQTHPTIFRYKDGKYRCCPLMNWGIQEIAAYVAMHGIRLLDEYEKNGLEARTTARITKMMAEEGGMAYLKQKNLGAFNQIVGNFPELRQYV